MGDFVDTVPTQLLSGKGRDIEFLKDLGEGGAVAKDIGEEHVDAIDAKFFAEILATIEELPDEGFPAGEVTVRFDPHGANGFPIACLDGFFDSFKKLWVIDFKPLVLACLAVDIEVAGISLGEAELNAGCMGHFEFGHAEGPEPGGVEVSVPHGVEGVSGFGGDAAEGVFDQLSAVAPSAVIFFLESVADFIESSDEEVPRGVSFIERFKEIEGELGIVEQRKPFFVKEGDTESFEFLRLGGAGFFRSKYGGFFVMGVCLEEEINFGFGRVEAEVFVAEVEATDLGVVLPDGSFDIRVGFPLEFRVGAVDKDGGLSFGDGRKFARDVIPAFLIGGAPGVADGNGAESFRISGG